MTTTPPPLTPSWSSALSRPRDAISQVVASDPRRHLWLLARVW